ncbi:hypothetical protein BDW62DRAFT_112985 [Aspergillus aurantiobrunneus]
MLGISNIVKIPLHCNDENTFLGGIHASQLRSISRDTFTMGGQAATKSQEPTVEACSDVSIPNLATGRFECRGISPSIYLSRPWLPPSSLIMKMIMSRRPSSNLPLYGVLLRNCPHIISVVSLTVDQISIDKQTCRHLSSFQPVWTSADRTDT